MLGFSKFFRKPPEPVAAIDLGSNSFHMIVARMTDGHLQIIDRMKEMVRLGAGLQDDRTLADEAQSRALAEQALCHPIEVIAGREEARLVYLGVSRGLAASDERRLVVDIGAGSTELIIGDGFEPFSAKACTWDVSA